MKRIALLCGLLLVLVFVSACMPAASTPAVQTSNVAGFWQGLWQGFIILFSFIVSFFNHDVGIYEVHNNGGWYNFGYLLGVMMFFGGGGGGAAGAKKKW